MSERKKLVKCFWMIGTLRNFFSSSSNSRETMESRQWIIDRFDCFW